MPLIGEYRNPVVVLVRTLAAADATGEEVESWPNVLSPTVHWARVESPGGTEQVDAQRRSARGLTLRFRHLVTLAAVDMILMTEDDTVWSVSGVWRERGESGQWQTVCAISLASKQYHNSLDRSEVSPSRYCFADLPRFVIPISHIV